AHGAAQVDGQRVRRVDAYTQIVERPGVGGGGEDVAAARRSADDGEDLNAARHQRAAITVADVVEADAEQRCLVAAAGRDHLHTRGRADRAAPGRARG